jgi:N-acetyl-anhydromuramyl-L-alanine amidase AmpD
MSEIKNGLLIDPLIIQNIVPNIEHGDFDIKKVQAIVLHQTETVSAEKTIEVWKTRVYGTHFLVDRGGDEIHTGIDGKIYQTAKLNRSTQHVGNIQSRCLIAKVCEIPKGAKTSLEAQAEAIKNGKLKTKAVNKIEFPKAYPNRFPVNSDSIGIEIVTKFDYKQNVYPPPSQKQILAVSYLLEKLIENIPAISAKEDIYTHGDIGRKQPSEGTQTITIYTDIKSNAATYVKQMLPKK